MARISTRALSQFCHRVGNSLQAGIDVRKIWDMESHRGTSQQQAVMRGIHDRIARGESLSTAFAESGGFFPPLVCEMVEVGERTGRLDEVFLKLGDHCDHQIELQRVFLMSISWPMIELSLAIVAIGVFIWLYGFLDLKTMDGSPMTILGLYGTSGLLIYVLSVAAILGVVSFPFVAARRGWVDLGPLYRLLAYIPGIGGAIRSLALSRLSWALSMSTDSSLDAQRAVELAVRSTQNSYYTVHLDRMRREIRQGRSLHTAFEVTGAYPAEFLDALDTGETAGRISETMAILARQMQDRARSQCRVLAIAASILVLFAVFGLIISFIFKMFFQVYGPLFDMLKTM
jgi:type II secretory pathway component PulF